MADAVLGRLCAAVAAPALMAHVEEFAKRVKLSGTPEERESLAYVQARMEAFGYRTTLIEHDAYISLPGKARVAVGGRDLTAITHSFSRPSPPGGVRAPLVAVGAGAPKAFEENEVRGKIVLVDGIASPAVSQRATEAGAVGQLHVSPHQYLHEMCISPVWGSPSSRTRGRLPRTVVCTIAHEDGDALKRRLAAGEQVSAVLEAKVDTGWRKTPILVAELAAPGADGNDAPFVMFSGHHDTWHYGVMDNGTANATMLECARILAEERAQWRRGLRFCFWSGHSHGRYSGSSWYADEYWDELEQRCIAHVNVDSTGAKGNTFLGEAPSVAQLTPLAREAVLEQGQQEISGERMSRAGDQSFWGIGVPSMFMSVGHQDAAEATDVMGGVLHGATGPKRGAGLGWWWHTPHDLIDKIEPELLVRDTRIFVHTLWRLLNDKVVPLDYAAFAEYMLRELASLGEGLDGRFDMAPLIAGATALRDKAIALREVAARADATQAPAIDRALMRVSRAMVPLDYTNGDRFEPDPALPLPSFPLLQPLRRLAALPAGAEQAKFIVVTLTRARNQFVHALREANAALDACLASAAPPQQQTTPQPKAQPQTHAKPQPQAKPKSRERAAARAQPAKRGKGKR